LVDGKRQVRNCEVSSKFDCDYEANVAEDEAGEEGGNSCSLS